MRFRRPAGGVLEFSRSAVTTLLAYRQVGLRSLEAGGILLGRQILGGNDVVIDAASEPTRDDRRARFWFHRARRPAQALIERAWQESGGVVNYLGDWHSHPEQDPTPSCVDRRGWKKIARQTTAECPELFFVIVGIRTIGVWSVTRPGGAVTQLERVAEQSGIETG